jgi:hypothetical protein
MKKQKAAHDKFHDDQSQVSNAYEYQEPPELASIDETAGGVNVRPALITDPHHRARFVPTQEPERSYFRKGGK